MAKVMSKKSAMGRKKKLLEHLDFDGWEYLEAMVVWSSEQHCADKLGMNIDTLAARIKEKFGLSFSEYKAKKQEVIRIKLFQKQFDVAMDGNVTMLIWLGKQYLGQSDKVTVQEEVELVTDFQKDETSTVKK